MLNAHSSIHHSSSDAPSSGHYSILLVDPDPDLRDTRAFCSQLRVRWGTTKLGEFRPLAFQNWLKSLVAKPKTKGHLKAFVHRLFNKAKLYEMVDFHENPIALVEVRGI